MKNIKYLCFVLILGSVMFLTGCVFPFKPHEYDWNILVYMAADNNLERFALKDINEMERIGSTDKVNVLVLIDRANGYDKSDGDWTSTRLYRITKDNTNSDKIVSELIADYGELDTSNPDTLQNFVSFCNSKYKSKKTMLTMWDHGTGVYPRNIKTESRGIGIDITTGRSRWDILTTDEIRTALEKTGKKIDLVNMDACLMQMAEVVWELKGIADYITGSETAIPGSGNDFYSLLKYISDNPDADAKNISCFITDDFYNQYNNLKVSSCFSAIEMKGNFTEFCKSFSELSDALVNCTGEEMEKIYNIRKNSASICDTDNPEYIDLIDFITKVKNELIPGSRLRNMAEKLLVLTEKILINNKALGIYNQNYPEKMRKPMNGISVNLPYTDEMWSYYSGDDGYVQLKLGRETSWDDFIKKLVIYNKNKEPL